MQVFLKRIVTPLLLGCFLFSASAYAATSVQVDTEVSTQLVKGEAGILMEASTGEVLYEFNPDKPLQIASVTKTMTMLLIMEALDSGKIALSDMVTCSEYAASMGGSQVFLEAGEQMTVDDMLKAIVVASGNDAAVAMAEHLSGTHEAFVETMNKRAAQLGLSNTHFINCNGLDETQDHYSCARDLAVICQELLKHPLLFDYTTIWMDTLRNGTFGLSNTNKLIRFYQGANGMKTGSTSLAKYCLAATAERNGMQLIAVVLGAPSTAERFGSATALLDFGFANYEVVNASQLNLSLPPVPVRGGVLSTVSPMEDNLCFVVKKGNAAKVESHVELFDDLCAPLAKGDPIGAVRFTLDGEEIMRLPLLSEKEIARISMGKMYQKLLHLWLDV